MGLKHGANIKCAVKGGASMVPRAAGWYLPNIISYLERASMKVCLHQEEAYLGILLSEQVFPSCTVNMAWLD